MTNLRRSRQIRIQPQIPHRVIPHLRQIIRKLKGQAARVRGYAVLELHLVLGRHESRRLADRVVVQPQTVLGGWVVVQACVAAAAVAVEPDLDRPVWGDGAVVWLFDVS